MHIGVKAAVEECLKGEIKRDNNNRLAVGNMNELNDGSRYRKPMCALSIEFAPHLMEKSWTAVSTSFPVLGNQSLLHAGLRRSRFTSA